MNKDKVTKIIVEQLGGFLLFLLALFGMLAIIGMGILAYLIFTNQYSAI